MWSTEDDELLKKLIKEQKGNKNWKKIAENFSVRTNSNNPLLDLSGSISLLFSLASHSQKFTFFRENQIYSVNIDGRRP